MSKTFMPSATSAGDESLTVRDVARRKRVSQRTVLNWVERGVITPSIHIGRVLRFNAREVEVQLTEASQR